MEDSTNSRPGKGTPIPWGASQWRRWLAVSVAALTLFGGFAYIGYVTQKGQRVDDETAHLAAGTGGAALTSMDGVDAGKLGGTSSEPAIARGDLTGAPHGPVSGNAVQEDAEDVRPSTEQSRDDFDGVTETIADRSLIGAEDRVGANEALDDPNATNAEHANEVIEQSEQRVNIPAGVKQMPWLSPVNGKTIRPFGWTESPTYGDWRWHHGIDIEAAIGTSVVAALPGTVKEIRNDARLGALVVLAHKDNVSTVYAPCADLSVKIGDEIPGGAVLCKVGKSGLDETGMPDHLHFEIRHADKPVDPATLLPQ